MWRRAEIVLNATASHHSNEVGILSTDDAFAVICSFLCLSQKKDAANKKEARPLQEKHTSKGKG